MLKNAIRLSASTHRAFLPLGVSKNVKDVEPSRAFASQSQTKDTPAKWDLVSAVCLERHPVITKPMQDIEVRFQEMLNQLEFEKSLKCDFELQMEAEKQQQQMQKKGLVDVDIENVVQHTAQDLIDAGQAELEQYVPAPRITEFDKTNEKTSLERKLDKNLVLLVQQKIGESSLWIPPQSTRREGETMKQAAERTLQELCGTEITAKFYGNAPVGFYKYVYPKSIRDNGPCGAKVFFFLAKYVNGHVTSKVNHQWLDRQELMESLPPKVRKSISSFMVFD